MLKKILAGVFSGLLAAFLPACDGLNLGKLKPGVTSLQAVREIMGAPSMEWQDADGSLTLEYPRTPQGMVNYMIDFGPDQILRQVRQVLTEANFARVRPGMSMPEIRRLLGRPAHEIFFPLQQEHVWDWKIKADAGMEQFFNVHFSEAGLVLRTTSNLDPKG
jgi:hypothetical protein